MLRFVTGAFSNVLARVIESPLTPPLEGNAEMRTLALLALICFLPACSITWKGGGLGVTQEQQKADIQDVYALSNAYELNAYFANQRRRSMGRANAFGRDLVAIQNTIDRHFFNYSESDPYINHETDTYLLDHLHRYTVDYAVNNEMVRVWR